jgi:uncharacterized membrane protein
MIVSAVVPKGLVLSLVAVAILLFTGRKGWEMVYQRRVGVLEEEWGPGATTLKARRRTSAAE